MILGRRCPRRAVRLAAVRGEQVEAAAAAADDVRVGSVAVAVAAVTAVDVASCTQTGNI
jgi:hypothetical protein